MGASLDDLANGVKDLRTNGTSAHVLELQVISDPAGVDQLRVAQEHYLSRAQNISTIATLFSGGMCIYYCTFHG
jgi:hypothetical protein